MYAIRSYYVTYTFKIKRGVTFASGNKLSADDVVFSLRRVVLLDKSPAFILTQFGFTPENVEKTITKLRITSYNVCYTKLLRLVSIGLGK